MTGSRTAPAAWTLALLAASLLLVAPTLARAASSPAPALDGVAPLTLIYPGTGSTAAGSTEAGASAGDTPHTPGLPAEGTLRVYWFWSSKCACSERSEGAIAEFARRFPDVELFVVHANADESIELARQTATERGFDRPIYRDSRARLAIAFNARATPYAVVLDHRGVVYQGRTDNIGRSKRAENFVAHAVAQKLAGEPVKPATRRPVGCALTRP